MPNQSRSTERLIQAAMQLFVAQGITATTTRQIAELAGVNEVTLFRRFGTKQGLLLTLLQEPALLNSFGEALGQQATQAAHFNDALHRYGQIQLEAIDQAPELLRSIIGEAGQYSSETAQTLAQTFQQINHYTAEYLATVLPDQPPPHLPVATIASLLNYLLLGYAVLEAITPAGAVEENRTEFFNQLGVLFQQGALAQLIPPETDSSPAPAAVADLPGAIVHLLLQRAKKSSAQDYALAYLLFAAGLSAAEVADLYRAQSQSDRQQHILHLDRAGSRQIPVNQWILGQRYGSYTRNPLTQWLKSRKDEQPAMFINETGNPLSEVEVRLRWQVWAADLPTAISSPPAIEQAQSTWCVEMLTKGMSPEELNLLTGLSIAQLQRYAQRAQEKAVLERALQLDQS